MTRRIEVWVDVEHLDNKQIELLRGLLERSCLDEARLFTNMSTVQVHEVGIPNQVK